MSRTPLTSTPPTDPDYTEWDARADVLHHFYAFRYFDDKNEVRMLDLVNLDQVDIEYFNRTGVIIKSLKQEHKLADYLATPHAFKLSHHYLPPTTVPNAQTNRHRFLLHVQAYNSTQTIQRRRLFVANLTSSDIKFLASLDKSAGKTLSIASDCLFHEHENERTNEQNEAVEENMKHLVASNTSKPAGEDVEKALAKSLTDLKQYFARQKAE